MPNQCFSQENLRFATAELSKCNSLLQKLNMPMHGLFLPDSNDLFKLFLIDNFLFTLMTRSSNYSTPAGQMEADSRLSKVFL